MRQAEPQQGRVQAQGREQVPEPRAAQEPVLALGPEPRQGQAPVTAVVRASEQVPALVPALVRASGQARVPERAPEQVRAPERLRVLEAGRDRTRESPWRGSSDRHASTHPAHYAHGSRLLS